MLSAISNIQISTEIFGPAQLFPSLQKKTMRDNFKPVYEFLQPTMTNYLPGVDVSE